MTDPIITRQLSPYVAWQGPESEAPSNVQKMHNAPPPSGGLISAAASISARIEAQVMATRSAVAQLGLCAGDLATIDALTGHFLTMAQELRTLPAAPADPCSPWLHPAGHCVHRHDCPEAVANGWARDPAPAAPKEPRA